MNTDVARRTIPDLVLSEIPELPRWANAWLNAKRSEGKRPRTLRHYKEKIALFLDYCAKRNVHTIGAVDAMLLREFFLFLEEAGHNPGGVMAYYRVVRNFFRWYSLETDEPFTALRKVKPPKVELKIIEPVKLEEVAAMIKICPSDWRGKRDVAIFLTLLDTGLRANELTGLDLADLDQATGELKVRHAKNGEARLAWIGLRARRAVRVYLKHRGSAPGPLFKNRFGERMGYECLRGIIYNRAKEAGLKELPSAHDFRRGAAIGLLRNGADVLTVSRLLGHKGLEVTRRYLRQTPEDLRQAHAANSPVDRANW